MYIEWVFAPIPASNNRSGWGRGRVTSDERVGERIGVAEDEGERVGVANRASSDEIEMFEVGELLLL